MSELAKQLIEQEKQTRSGRLDLGRCGLTNLNDIPELFELAWLTELVLSNRWWDFEKRKWIESQNIGPDNQLSALPPALSRLARLESLKISGDYLNDWPISDARVLEKLSKLTSLDLRSNQISDIRFLEKLSKLSTLDLRSNRIHDISPLSELIRKGIPVSMEQHSRRAINLYNNPIAIPPLEIVNQGNEAILRYFDRLQKAEEKDYLYEAKVLLVGRTGAGKTSMRYKLRHIDTPMPVEDESTRGIDVETIEVMLDDHTKFRMNIWDFEGQQISHQTHQFFLTRRSFYVFVADQRTEKADFDYWLQIVELLSDNSPMMVFHNEKKEHICDLNLDGIRQRFGHFLKEEEHRANLDALGQGKKHNTAHVQAFGQFRSSLVAHMKSLPIVGIPIEKSWVLIRGAIEKLARQKAHITADELWKICIEHGVIKPIDQQDLSQLFHDLGIFLHFQEQELASLLNRMVILQNDWATKAVYMVLKSEWLRNEKRGHFVLSDLRKVWENTDYAKHSEELLELMMRFELCYRVGESKFYIAPQLLPANPPKYHFPETGLLLLRYGYDFMPKGLITRLTVRMHPYIAENQTLVWKDGFVAEGYGAVAEVTETYGKREIHIRASGEYRRKLLNEIAYEMDRLNETYNFNERLQSNKLLPCCCADCLTSTEPHFFKYREVINWKRTNWQQVPCGKTGNPASVSDLLSNIIEGEEDERFEKRHFAAELKAVRHSQKITQEKLDLLSDLINQLNANWKEDISGISRQLSEQPKSNVHLETLLNDMQQNIIKSMQALPQSNAWRQAWEKKQSDIQAMNIDAKSKIELCLPFIPGILSYKTEFATDFKGSVPKKLKQLWADLKSGKAFIDRSEG